MGVLRAGLGRLVVLGSGGKRVTDAMVAGTALLHSLAVTEQRASFKAWTLLLAICAFSLCLLGTFLVRSGVLVSVHAFTSDPARAACFFLPLWCWWLRWRFAAVRRAWL